jgi:endonuclease/exonuclease/phosphatase family metal-dependent hydrolase
MANIVKTILAEKPDVFCLQEANFRDRLLFPGYEIFKTDQFLIGTTDKIEGLKLAPLVHGYPNALEFRTHGVRVVNIHLASFAFQHVARQRLLGVPGHMMDIARLHERQIEKLMGHYEKDAVPTVICGDFNNPPRGKNYQRMTRSFMDSFAKTGSGFGYTFPSNMPLQRIDYIFARGLEPVSAKVVFTRASDHMPVVATFDTGHLPPVYVLRGSARPARS